MYVGFESKVDAKQGEDRFGSKLCSREKKQEEKWLQTYIS